MNVIGYITITCNLKNVRLQITFDYMKNVIDYNRLRLPHVCYDRDEILPEVTTNTNNPNQAQLYILHVIEWVSYCWLAPIQQFFSYIKLIFNETIMMSSLY